ncbi:MAG: hypothetical protein KDA90_21220, partial [Planctomycetaceae bacterium]|nr:hypothetical protein [Planctomycetaceae bacterium]
FHFEMGGNSHKALIYSLLAAEQAKTQFALNVALEKYRTAKALSHTGSNHIQYRVLSGMGHALLLSGRYQDAYDTLESAATHANNERDRIKTKARQGEIIYKTRSLNESTQALEQLLFELGYPIPRGQLQTLIEITISSVQLKWLNLRRPNKLSECKPDWKTDLTIRILMQVCYPTLFSDGMKALWASKKALRLASNRSSDAILSSALSIESLVSSRFLPRLQRIQSLSNQAIQLAHDLNDNALTAEAWHLQAASVGALAPSQGRKSSEEAIQRYHQLGDAWRLTYGHAFLAIIQSYLGEFAECIAGSQKAFESAISYGQHRLAQTVLKPWATATGGRLRFDELKSQVIVVTDDLQSTVLLNVAESIWHRHHARTAESLVSAELAFSIMRDYWPFSPLVSVAYPNLVQSLRHHADAVQERDPKQSERIRTRALKLARRGVLVQRIARLDLAYALRELGQCYADIGKIGKAHKVVLRSCRVAVERNANYEHAQSLYVYGRLSEKLRIPEASRQIQEAERLLAGFESQIDEAIRRQQEIT